MFRYIFVIVLLSGLLPGGSFIQAADINGRQHDQSRDTGTKQDAALNNLTVDGFIPPVNCWSLNTGMIDATMINTGQLGAGFEGCRCDDARCPSFVSPPGSGVEYLFAGAVWIGGIVGTDTLVTTGLDGWLPWQELYPTVKGYPFEYVGHQAIWTMAVDTFTAPDGIDPDHLQTHRPMNIRLANRAFYRQSSPENNLIIYDMVITNLGNETINEGYVGLYIDGDAYHISRGEGYCDDLVGSLPDHSLAYIIDNDGDPLAPDYQFTDLNPTKALAAKFLRSSFAPRDSSFNWWISNIETAYDIGPRRIDDYGNPQCSQEPAQNRGTPLLDRNKYCYLSNGEWDYDLIYSTDTIEGWEPFAYPQNALDFAFCIDPRFLLSLGTFDLLPDSSARIILTTFTADPVHTDPTNLENLWIDKAGYLANLNFAGIIDNAALGDMMVDSLLNPTNPVIGLYAPYAEIDSVVIEWDPWVFDDVTGYNIYLEQVPETVMPYPGIVPPWAVPDNPSLIAQTDKTWRYTIDGLEPYRFFFASASHRTNGGIGRQCDPILISTGERIPAPAPDDKYLFIQPGEPVMFGWEGPPGIDIDHYNIYEFAGWTEYLEVYSPFYDTGEARDSLAPKDSFYVDGVWYYYYALEAAAQVDGADTSYIASGVDDSTVYLITAVDSQGYESGFSSAVLVLHRGPRDREIAVVTYGLTSVTFADHDTVAAFYDSTLQGYDFEIYELKDSININREPYEWLWADLLPFEMVVWEDGLRDGIISDWPDGSMPKALEKYLLSGGTIAYFGAFGQLSPSPGMEDPPAYKPIMHWFGRDYFGIDSVLRTGLVFYADQHFDYPAAEDTLIGMILAEAVNDTIPDVVYDISRNPFFPGFDRIWPTTTAPMVSTYVLDTRGETTHRLRSLYPQMSLVEDHPVGVLTVTDRTRTYAFGFQPWYMQHADFRALVDDIMGGIPLEAENYSMLPALFSLSQNRPNPFNPNTQIMFYLPGRSAVRLEVFDILGRRLRTLVDDWREGGEHTVEFDGRDGDGVELASGVYFYRLKTGNHVAAKKMILLK